MSADFIPSTCSAKARAPLRMPTPISTAYAHAIDVLGANAGRLAGRPGISIKLSALHPRFEAISRLRVMTELVPRLIQLVASARAKNIAVTIDAEEADRLELSLDVFEALCQEPDLAGWAGFGLAVQAYQKRAEAVLDFVFDLARRYDRRFAVRLVKGAYWDTEIKRAQERGLADYPVFSRKAMTDLNYIVCAQKMLDARERIFPQFATHNALTVASSSRAPMVPAATNSNACTAWARSFIALCARLSRNPLPHLCACRHLSRSSRLSRAAAFGEWRQFVLRRESARLQAFPSRRCCAGRRH